MPIIKIKGGAGSGKTMLATALRNTQINQRKGCLVLDDDTRVIDPEGNSLKERLLEKIIDGAAFDADNWKNLPWKKDTLIIAINEREALIDEFEQLMPGFTEMMGPVWEVQTKTAE